MVFPIVGGDGKPTGYEISNSARFQPNDYVSRYDGVGDESSNAGKIGTVSLWTKRGDFGRAQGLFVVYEHNGQGYQTIWFNSDDTLQLAYEISGTEYQVKTNAKFRDPSAWYHVVAMTDTTQSTDSNRMKIYVNGTEQTYSSTAYPPQGTTLLWGKGNSTNYQYRIGNQRGVGSTSYAFYNGYIAEVHLCMGQNYTASEFGETNDNGVWIPKEADVSYGTNGGYYEFKQTGTDANASGIGADTSGTGNHATIGGLDATNITEDTPTNNFCTMNPLAIGADATLSEGNCQIAYGSGTRSVSTANMGFANGKWYWEWKISAASTDGCSAMLGIGALPFGPDLGVYLGQNSNGYSYNGEDGQKFSGGANSSYGNNFTTNDIISVAFDADNGNLYFYKNGTIQNSGTAAYTGLTSPSSGFHYPAIGDASGVKTFTAQANFGNAPFSISSGNTDGLYGNFEYAPPSGYYALCTKLLATYG